METLTFSFLKRVRTFPSSLSTRRRSCSLFWQLRMSLMNTERPRIPDNAIAAQIHTLTRTHAQRERNRNRFSPSSRISDRLSVLDLKRYIQQSLRRSAPKKIFKKAKMRIERERRGFDLRDCRERKQLFLFRERERKKVDCGKLVKPSRSKGRETTFIYYAPIVSFPLIFHLILFVFLSDPSFISLFSLLLFFLFFFFLFFSFLLLFYLLLSFALLYVSV